MNRRKDKRNRVTCLTKKSDEPAKLVGMIPDLAFRPVGALALTILIAGLVFLALKWPRSVHMTFSQHAAQRKLTVVYYIALFAIVLPLFFAFFAFWFVPQFKISEWFIHLILISLIAQFVVTLIPETVGWRVGWHKAFAGISALLLLPCMLLLIYTGEFSFTERWIAWAGSFMMLSIVLKIALSRKNLRFLLIMQALYFVSFFVPIIILAYL